MLKKYYSLLLVLVLIFTISIPALGADTNEQAVSLDNAFMGSALLPFDYNGYAFANGSLVTYNNDTGLKNYNVNGRVLVPVRLVEKILYYNRTNWYTFWDTAKPDVVVLTNNSTSDKVVVTVGSKTMQVNGEDVSLDIPARVIENRILLPLRAIGEAMNMEISWLDGMVIISKVPIDLSCTKTKDVVEMAKSRLNSCVNDMANKLCPIAAVNNSYYALKAYHDDNENHDVMELYSYKNGVSEKVDLAGSLGGIFIGTNGNYLNGMVGNSIYYPAIIGSETKLYRLDFATNKSVEICSLSGGNVGWSLNGDGWFKGVSIFGQDIYVVLHTGDGTMGGDVIYRLENNSLVKVGDLKWLSSMAEVGTKLYYTDLEFMRMTENNLYYLDFAKGVPTANIALEGYTYDIVRETADTSVSHGISVDMVGLAMKDNFIYAMLYEEKAEKDNRNVVKIDTTDNKQVILPIEISKFWLVNDGIVYIEYTSGKLTKSDFDGNNARVLVDRNLDKIKVYGNDVYYTVTGEAGLFHLNAVTGAREKLSDLVVNEILINKSGTYFINASYDAGIFKINGGKITKIADGFVCEYTNTDVGILYNKRGSMEVYLAN